MQLLQYLVFPRIHTQRAGAYSRSGVVKRGKVRELFVTRSGVVKRGKVGELFIIRPRGQEWHAFHGYFYQIFFSGFVSNNLVGGTGLKEHLGP